MNWRILPVYTVSVYSTKETETRGTKASYTTSNVKMELFLVTIQYCVYTVSLILLHWRNVWSATFVQRPISIVIMGLIQQSSRQKCFQNSNIFLNFWHKTNKNFVWTFTPKIKALFNIHERYSRTWDVRIRTRLSKCSRILIIT